MQKDEQLQILKDLIQIQTPNGNELAVSEYIGKLFDRYHVPYKIDRFDDNRANLVAEIGEGKTDQVLAFEGHQDTVAVSDPDKWEHQPFEPFITDGKLYGRGSADMKSGLAAEVISLIELVADKVPIKGKIRLIATAGEEYGTPGANRLAANGIAKDVSAMVVGEPTSGQVVYAHSGSLNYQIKSYGKAVHSSIPEKGINVIVGLSKYIDAEAGLFDQAPKDPFLGTVKHSVTLIKGGEQVNIIPDYAELAGNIRPALSFDNDHVIQTIKTAIDKINSETDYHLEFSLIHNFRPVETDPKNQFVQLAKNVASDKYQDRSVGLTTINGATDASVFIKNNPNMAVVVLGPDAWKVAHQTNEYTTLDSFYETIQVYQAIVKRYFG